jgi:hypothetical protein
MRKSRFTEEQMVASMTYASRYGEAVDVVPSRSQSIAQVTLACRLQRIAQPPQWRRSSEKKRHGCTRSSPKRAGQRTCRGRRSQFVKHPIAEEVVQQGSAERIAETRAKYPNDFHVRAPACHELYRNATYVLPSLGRLSRMAQLTSCKG